MSGTRQEHINMVIMGYLLGSMIDLQLGNVAPKQRERQRFKYYHKGKTLLM